MGVYYRANFGIGADITKSDIEEAVGEEVFEKEYSESIYEFFAHILEDNEDYTETCYGNAYDGEDNWAIIIIDPFGNSESIDAQINKLYNFLHEKGLNIPHEKIGLVGGLRIS